LEWIWARILQVKVFYIYTKPLVMSLSSLLDVVLPGYIMVRENSLTAGCSENKLVVCLLQVITSNKNQTKIHTFPSASTLLFRELDHANVIRLIDSCSRPPCIITGETSCYQHLSLDKKDYSRTKNQTSKRIWFVFYHSLKNGLQPLLNITSLEVCGKENRVYWSIELYTPQSI